VVLVLVVLVLVVVAVVAVGGGHTGEEKDVRVGGVPFVWVALVCLEV
jgi:hypothetical protein